MHVGVKGWMEVEKNFTNLQTKITNTHRLILWTLFFYTVILSIVIYCFVTDFSNIQEFIYSEF